MNFFFGEQYLVGESSFWIEVLMTFLGAFFGFGLTLALYWWQQRRNKKKAEKKQFEAYIREIKYLILTLKEIITATSKQCDLMDTFINLQRESFVQLQVLKRVPNQNFKRLYSSQSKGVFEAWESVVGKKDSNIGMLNKLNFRLDYIEGTTEDDLFRVYHNHTNDAVADQRLVRDLIHQTIDELSKVARAERFKLGETRFDDPYYQFVNGLILGFHKELKERSDMDRINAVILQPLVEGYAGPFSVKPDSDHIGLLAKDARVRLTAFKQDVGNFCGEVDRIKGELRTKVGEVQGIVDCLETKVNP
jgi:hypothetical protein